jgi:hypothetical protein
VGVALKFSSENLHPTEAYCVSSCLPGPSAEVYRYVSYDHRNMVSEYTITASMMWGVELPL